MFVICGNCRHGFEQPGARAGDTCACPRCGHQIVVPSAEAEADGAAGLAGATGSEAGGFAEQARQIGGRKIAVVCGACGRVLKVGARLAGKTRRCPSCGAAIQIPYPDDAEEPSPPAPPAEGAAPQPVGGAPAGQSAAAPAAGGAPAVEGAAAPAPGEKPAAGPPAPPDRAAPLAEESHPSAPDRPAVPAGQAAGRGPGRHVADRPGGRRRIWSMVGVSLFAAVALASAAGLFVYRLFFWHPAEREPLPPTQPAEVVQLPPDQPVELPQTEPDDQADSNGQIVSASSSQTSQPAAAHRLVIRQAVVDLFLADGYLPAMSGEVYWKLTVELTAVAQPWTVRPSRRQVVLRDRQREWAAMGTLEAGVLPSQRVSQKDILLTPGQMRTVTLLFRVPARLTEAVLVVAPLGPAPVRVEAGAMADPGPGLHEGTYTESPPRNLAPLLGDPVMAALEACPEVRMQVRPGQGRWFVVSFPAAGVDGQAQTMGAGVYRLTLRRGGASLDCRLRLFDAGRRAILYLREEPFRQITLAAP